LAHYTSYYFETESGRQPVKEFIDSLDQVTQRKFFTKRELLEEFGPRFSEPHAKTLGHHIYELRFQGRDGHFRICYFFFEGDQVIFTNAFRKQTNKTPKHELELAIQRRKVFLSRER